MHFFNLQRTTSPCAEDSLSTIRKCRKKTILFPATWVFPKAPLDSQLKLETDVYHLYAQAL